MKILQINVVYAKSSTGRTTKEMHEYFLSHGIESFVASPDLAGLKENCFKIGGEIDHKFHALVTRVLGLQGYSSHFPTKRLLKWMTKIKPDVVILRNLHSNYINLPLLTAYLAKQRISTILVLHDSWFITGGCTYYIAPNCNKWLQSCGNCPALRNDIASWGVDCTRKVLKDRKKFFSAIPKLSIVGVSQWVADDAKRSILGNAFSIQCIYNWIDLETFRPKDRKEIREKYGFKSDEFLVLGVSASWSAAKGINVFIGLSSILPQNQHIVLVGNSDSIENKPSGITFLPATSNINQLADYYAMADVFVNPTIQETFGKTTAEALSCGTPVVAYYGTATPELVGTDEKCGFLIRENRAEEYAKKINLIYDTGTKSFSKNCRMRSEQLFDKEKNLQSYIALFNKMV
ncbi:MAG: glycosyltransferase [Prevotellaceae bacterium]|nr:glycosyltransferase [Candidatus Faecinaster equi]